MRTTFGVLTFLLACGACAEPVREVEITSNPPENGQQILNVRITPGQTVTYEKITIDCVLHQEFPSESTHKNREIKIHEPAVFTHRRKDVKMVEELDVNISFRVPVGMNRLMEIYGMTAFNTNYPVTVSRMIISATSKGGSWSYEIPASGAHKPPFPSPAQGQPQVRP